MLHWFKRIAGGAKAPKPKEAPSVPAAEQIRQWLKDGFAHFQAGNQEAALDLFGKILREQGEHADALYLSGAIASSQGRPHEAVALISRAIASDGSIASFHFTLGNSLMMLQQEGEALASYRQAVLLDPSDSEFRNSLGCALHRSGQSREALEHLLCAVHQNPKNAELHYNYGVVLQSLGRVDEAATSYRDALSLNNKHACAGNNLGAILHAQGQLSDAIACFRRILEFWPEDAQAWTNLGISLQAYRRVDEAETSLLRAISLDPLSFSAHSNLALVFREMGKLDASIASSERALAIRDSLGERIRQATLLPVVAHSASEIKAWRQRFDGEVSKLLMRGGVLDDPLGEVGVCNFNLAYQPECNKNLQKKTAQLYSAVFPGLNYVAAHCRHQPKSTGGRIKVGFISKHMHDHSIGKTTRGLFANIARDRFHVSALFVPPFVEDPISNFIRDCADHFLILPTTLEAAREKIAALELDILFYQDIGMDSFTYFLAFSRLAPVQCVSFGHPDTTGIPNMDYWVSSDNFELESAETHYSEELFMLRNIGSLAYYYRPVLNPLGKSRRDFGLAQDLHLYLCPQTLFKLHPDLDAIFAEILRRDPQGEIMLIEAKTPVWGELLRKRFQETIPDVVGRIRFLPGMSQNDFLALIALSDVMLDTIYFNGMNTSLEALAVGTPVVTMPTSLQRGRHTFGMYKRMGMDDCIARTPEEYVSIALRLGTDSNFRDEMKEKILSRCMVLYEDVEVVREFERFFVEAHGRTLEHGDRVNA